MEKLVLWVDDLRDPPNRPGERYVIARNVNEAKCLIEEPRSFDIIDLDHDAGAYVADGGDYINILNYLEARAHNGYEVKSAFRIHSFNTVGYMNMKAIIEHNGWRLEQ